MHDLGGSSSVATWRGVAMQELGERACLRACCSTSTCCEIRSGEIWYVLTIGKGVIVAEQPTLSRRWTVATAPSSALSSICRPCGTRQSLLRLHLQQFWSYENAKFNRAENFSAVAASATSSIVTARATERMLPGRLARQAMVPCLGQ